MEFYDLRINMAKIYRYLAAVYPLKERYRYKISFDSNVNKYLIGIEDSKHMLDLLICEWNKTFKDKNLMSKVSIISYSRYRSYLYKTLVKKALAQKTTLVDYCNYIFLHMESHLKDFKIPDDVIVFGKGEFGTKIKNAEIIYKEELEALCKFYTAYKVKDKVIGEETYSVYKIKNPENVCTVLRMKGRELAW